MQRLWSTPLVAASGLAVALAGAACSNSNTSTKGNTSAENRIAATSGPRDAPVTLTGCLQKGSGFNTFILAPANTATHGSVGSSGSAASGDVVGREQEAAAVRSYRLSGDNDQLSDMVGKQVRVRGRMTDRGDLNGHGGESREAQGTSGAATRDRQDIDAGDLAKVDVDSIEKVADACGTGAADAGSGSARRPRPATK